MQRSRVPLFVGAFASSALLASACTISIGEVKARSDAESSEAGVDSDTIDSAGDASPDAPSGGSFCAQEKAKHGPLLKVCIDFDDGQIGNFASFSPPASLVSDAISAPNALRIAPPSGGGATDNIFDATLPVGTRRLYELRAFLKAEAPGDFSLSIGNIYLECNGNCFVVEYGVGAGARSVTSPFSGNWAGFRLIADYAAARYKLIYFTKEGVERVEAENISIDKPSEGFIPLRVRIGTKQAGTLLIDNFQGFSE